MIKKLRLHAIQLKSLMSRPQRLFSHKLAYRTISDSDEEEFDCGGRPLQEWEIKPDNLDCVDPVIDSLNDEQSQLLCYLFLSQREKYQVRQREGVSQRVGQNLLAQRLPSLRPEKVTPSIDSIENNKVINLVEID